MIKINEKVSFLFSIIIIIISFSSLADMLQPGPYVGATLNTQHLDEQFTSDEAFNGTIRGKGEYSPGVGILFGTDFVRGQFIYGMAIDVGICNSVSKFSYSNNGNTINAKGKISFLGHARVRFGYGSNDLLPYIGLGIAMGNFHHEAAAQNISTRDVSIGPSLAAGLEYALTKSLRILGEVSYDIFPTLAGGLGDDSFYAKPIVTSFKVGMIYKLPAVNSTAPQSTPSFSPQSNITEIRFRSIG